MAMLTATASIVTNLRPLSPISFNNSRQISSLGTTRLHLKCHATKEDSPQSIESTRPKSETILHSFSPLPLLYAAALLPGGTYIHTYIHFTIQSLILIHFKTELN